MKSQRIGPLCPPRWTTRDLKCSLTDYVGRRVAASVLRRARAGVLQTFQKWPEIAGSKYGELAKPGERFQRLSPKAVVLPLHHSPTDYRTNSIAYGIVRVSPVRRSEKSPCDALRPSTRYLPALASARQSGFRAVLAAREIRPMKDLIACSRATADCLSQRHSSAASHRPTV